jgi:hypothetical protein
LPSFGAVPANELEAGESIGVTEVLPMSPSTHPGTTERGGEFSVIVDVLADCPADFIAGGVSRIARLNVVYFLPDNGGDGAYMSGLTRCPRPSDCVGLVC